MMMHKSVVSIFASTVALKRSHEAPIWHVIIKIYPYLTFQASLCLPHSLSFLKEIRKQHCSCRKAATGGPRTPPPPSPPHTSPPTLHHHPPSTSTTRDPWWWTLVKRHCSIEPASALHFNELMGEHGQLHTRHLLNREKRLKKIHFMLRGCLKSPI